MKTRDPKKMESFRKIFFLMGLNIVLFMVYHILEIQTVTGGIAMVDYGVVEDDPVILTDYTIEYPSPKKKVIPPKNKKIQKETLIKKDPVNIQQIDNDAPKQKEPPVNPTSVNTDVQQHPTVTPVATENPKKTVATYSIKGIESVPVFPGCKGNNEQLRKCFSKKIKAYVQKHFDPDIAADAGLSGLVKIRSQFVVDAGGYITDIKVRAPHRSLENELRKLLLGLPVMTPGKQNGKSVRVRYYLPVVFRVEE
jgi:protein TonB